MSLQLTDSVAVRNVHPEKTYVGVFEKRQTRIKPGAVAYVSYRAAITWFGNPALVNTDTSKPREQEFKHLLARYGVYYHTDRMEELLPRCEVFDMEANRIYMVLDDPDGRLRFAPDPTTVASSEAQIMERRAYELQNQVHAIMSVLGELHPDVAAKLAASPTFANSPGLLTGRDAVPVSGPPSSGLIVPGQPDPAQQSVGPLLPAPGTTGRVGPPPVQPQNQTTAIGSPFSVIENDNTFVPITPPPSQAFISVDPSLIDTLPSVSGDTVSVGADGPDRPAGLG